MSELQDREASNEKYLAASLEWLRLLLGRLSERFAQRPVIVGVGDVRTDDTAPGPVVGLHSDRVSEIAVQKPDAAGRRKRATAVSRKPVEPSGIDGLPPTASVSTVDSGDTEELTRAAEAMAAAAATVPPPAAVALARRLGLTTFESNVLLLTAAVELDTRISALCARAHDDPGRTYPTFALAFALFAERHWDALSPERPLRYWRLVEVHQSGLQTLTLSPLRCDERILNYLKGLAHMDERVSPLLTAIDSPDADPDLPPSQQAARDAIVHEMSMATAAASVPAIQLLGTDSSSKQMVAAHATAALDIQLFRLSLDLTLPQAGELDTVVRLWNRETMLRPVALYLDASDSDAADRSDTDHSPLLGFFARTIGPAFVDTRDLRHKLGRPSIGIEIAKPTAAEQQELWQALLSGAGDMIAPRLAGQFNMSRSEIQRTSRAVAAEMTTSTGLADRLWDACVLNTRPQLDSLAQRITPKAVWEDLVLPPEDRNLLHEIASQVNQRSLVYGEWGFDKRMNRGLGITALFVGESGTGKTMAAEVIAHELRLNLYRIDLSAVVSKYIGQTEKNLRRLFDAAEDGGALLFFDEADALFGKRAEVKESHDRFANIEINYLLQRMEGYRGLAILATNMKSALDVAFMRRLRFIVQFLFPAPAQRKQIWERVFPPEVPIESLDFARLSRLNLTGGSISNVAINAAFAAARGGGTVTMALVLAAARAEFRKLELPVNEADFRFQPAAGIPA